MTIKLHPPRLLLCLILSIASNLIHSENRIDDNIYFRLIDQSNGLSHNSVKSIIQSSDGYIYISTKEGVNRYDGRYIRQFKKTNSGLENDFINRLIETPDKKIWMGSNCGVYIYDPQTEEITPFDALTTHGERIENIVTDLTVGNDGCVWIAVDYQGLFCYNPANGVLENRIIHNFNTSQSAAKFSSLGWYGNQLMVGLYAEGLCTLAYGNRLVPVCDIAGNPLFEGATIRNITHDPHSDQMLIGTNMGLYSLDMEDRIVKKIDNSNVQAIRINNGYIWVCTLEGLLAYDENLHEIAHYKSTVGGDRVTMSDNVIEDCCFDKEGGMWLGTYYGGVNYYPLNHLGFDVYVPNVDSTFGLRVRSFLDFDNRTLLIGTEDRGIFKFDKATSKFEKLLLCDPNSNVRSMHADGDLIWIPQYYGGLSCIDTKDWSVTNFDSSNFGTDNCEVARRLKDNRLLVGTDLGLFKLNDDGKTFSYVDEIPKVRVLSIFEDSYGLLWVATFSNGLYAYNPTVGKWRNYTFQRNSANSLTSNKITSIYEDSRRQLWIMTESGGVCIYNRSSDSFELPPIAMSLTSSTVYAMQEDKNGCIWMSSNDGLVCFNPANNQVRRFTVSEGLISNQFNYNSTAQDSDGRLYFGSTYGFVVFNPDKSVSNSACHPIVLTGLEVDGVPAKIGTAGSPLSVCLDNSKTVRLNHRQSTISIHVSTMDFGFLSYDDLEYRIEGLDHAWSKVNPNGTIVYTNLPYHNNKLHIRSTTNPKISRDLVIKVSPPWYRSVVAYWIFAIIALLIAWYAYLYFKKWLHNKQQFIIEEIENQASRNLYNSRIEFFTNVMHEIRTPLSLIKAPLDEILSKPITDPEVLANLQTMEHNTDRLMELANQLLDLRKMDDSKMPLVMKEQNIVAVLQSVYSRFEPVIRKRNIQCSLHIYLPPSYPPSQLSMAIDGEAMKKVFSNLLNNALKYGLDFVEVTLTVKDEHCIINFGISFKNVEKIGVTD